MKIIEGKLLESASGFDEFQALKDIEKKIKLYLDVIYDVSRFTSVLEQAFGSKDVHTSIKEDIELYYPNILQKCKDLGIKYRFGDLVSKVNAKNWGQFLDAEK